MVLQKQTNGKTRTESTLYWFTATLTFSSNLVHEGPPSEFISQNNPCQSDINHGLYSNITQSLPITISKNKNEKEFKPRNNEWSVCLNEYEEGESLKHLSRCSHMFHAACIDSWFKYHLYCPLCRSQIFNLTCHDHSYSSVVNPGNSTFRVFLISITSKREYLVYCKLPLVY
ncbi:hypothetical protein K2173_015725 [Erythroxylum novogranatense]|uniref:RING-type E3 ubiquitin transferase n=1 Tax=Erythroxylum novogranatense TaxID=1862640 RepID=A0AAV8SEJ1_9ROSI|nr:hypothetical protein K2173_015725 [Erythroxylum novogranatense]